MKVWLTCFILLFGATEVLHWITQVSLPLPIFILGGAFLAIASNYDKLTHLPFHLDYEKPEPLQGEPIAAQVPPAPQAVSKDLRAPWYESSGDRSVSFTISKPHQPGD